MKLYSVHLKRHIRDCVLAIFWPKKDIYSFFKDCSVPTGSLKKIEHWDKDALTRKAMVDRIFESLDQQADSGTMQYTIMLEQLAAWNHFDSYWFEEQKTLDRKSAIQVIARLKIAKEGQIDRSRTLKDKEQKRNETFNVKHASLEEMRNDFHTIATTSASPQKRGYALESFLGRMARFFDLQVTRPFRLKGTQIDGGIKFDGENYNIEAKWEHQSMSDEPVLAFCHKQEINMHGRGLFISMNGFTPGAISIMSRGNIKNTVLMDGEDLTLILQELMTFPELLDAKIRAAQTSGRFYIHPFTGQSKIPID